jgi:SAM-dependent methyltransferase
VRVVAAQRDLVLTGERTLPGIWHENYWFRRHEAAYDWLAPFAIGAIVLEAGSGEGYGADLLAGSAYRAIGLDDDEACVAHVRSTYPRVRAVRGDLQALPISDGSVEVVACLQVIEHLHDQAGFLAECARVLRPAGTLLLTTPNRLTFSPGDAAPVNPFHTRELAAAELSALLAGRFVVIRMAGLRHGRALRGWERRHGSIVDAQLAGASETWPRRLGDRVAAVTSQDFVVTEHDVDRSLDLVAVATKRTGAEPAGPPSAPASCVGQVSREGRAGSRRD